MELTAAEVWSRILEEARGVLPEQAFRTWLAPTEAVAISRDLLVVSTPNPFAVDWVEDKYAELLTAIGERAFGRRFRLTVQYHGNGRAPALSATAADAPVPAPPSASPARSQGLATGVRTSSPLNDRYTFDRFVVGNNNQLAAAAAHAVAEAPARAYNPLFIYGGVGLGKTHLMHAIGQVIREREPGKRIIYISSERFTNELVTAIQEGTMGEFRRQFRQIDLLLVDDIQFLEGKERTQEEFFHTFNDLHDGQRQIVLTSDRPPKATGLEDRLVSRFEWGLVTDIKAPDFETRVAILRNKVREDRLEIANEEDVLTLIARHCTSSVREIEGAVIKLLAYASLTRRELNLDLAREALGGVLRGAGGSEGSSSSRLTPDGVRKRVAEAWDVTPEELQSKRRTKNLTIPRQVAMYLIKEAFDLPLVEIGKMFGGRDHSTVIHSISKVEEDIQVNPAFRQRVEALRAAIQ
ncbi:MAG: chromosomal replication initiator protein DnaA [Gemmatimonadetes bacterium]|nr:chromosomal replication initiator protein DnaA [Gemmatimonadota bacterium]